MKSCFKRWGRGCVAAMVVLGSCLLGLAVSDVAGGEQAPRTPASLQVSGYQIERPAQPARGPVAETQAIGGAVAGDRRVSVLVEMAVPTSRSQAGLVAARRAAVRGFATAHLGRVQYEYEILPNVMNLRNLPASSVVDLSKMPGVVRVVQDYVLHAALNNSVPLIRGLQSQINGAGIAADGSGVRICVVDTGIDSNHIMYASRIDTAAGFDFVNNDTNPEDDDGHGSHVSGVAVGGTGITVDFGCGGPEVLQGVAPAATLIGVKVLDSTGSGFASDIIAGIDWCASPTLPGGPADVINLSLAGAEVPGVCDGDIVAIAANNAVDAGLVVVAGAGNSAAANALPPPACASKVIAVGATYDENFPSCDVPQGTFDFGSCTDVNPAVDSLICFSNHSANLDVVAPGCVVFSADSTDVGGVGSGIVGFCGTSFSTPHVAGLAALLLSFDPMLTPAEVRLIIRGGAVDLGATGFDIAFGFGRIDVVNSLHLAQPSCQSDVDCAPGQVCVATMCEPSMTIGACCNANDTCTDSAQEGACIASGGTFLGAALTCAGDPDGDGFTGCSDVCPVSPAPRGVDLQGRPLGDLDQSCTVTLQDYSIMQGNLHGP